MKVNVSKIKRAARVAAVDGLMFGGMVLVVYGCWSVYQPVGVIVGGAFLMLNAVVYAKGEDDGRTG